MDSRSVDNANACHQSSTEGIHNLLIVSAIIIAIISDFYNLINQTEWSFSQFTDSECQNFTVENGIIRILKER